MGNKLGRRRQMVDEKYTRPQGLYHHRDVDHKKLKKLILDSKLAPCYPGDDGDAGDDECTVDLEECPICFLYYPSLNRSRCCTKRICTECFLQMKPPLSTRPTQCPFCKAPNYAVEYHGVRAKEEKGMEQVEEQRVIEAKIRMRQQELQDEEERMLKRQDISSSSRVSSFSFPVQNNEMSSSQDSHAMPFIRQSSHSRQNREDEFDLDLEEVMVMEAIWLSIQENGIHRNPAGGDSAPSVSVPQYRDPSVSVTMAESSPSGGFACAIAALAERQHTDGDSTAEAARNMPIFDTSLESSGLPVGGTVMPGNYTRESWIEVSPDSGRALSREEGDRGVVHLSEVEASTSYAGSDAMMEAGTALPILDGDGDHFQLTGSGPIMPESFEEQMMLAMAVSLAEARARSTKQGLSRH